MQLQQSYMYNFLLLHMLGADMLCVQLTHSPSQIVLLVSNLLFVNLTACVNQTWFGASRS
jgi:hypothetical protein